MCELKISAPAARAMSCPACWQPSYGWYFSPQQLKRNTAAPSPCRSLTRKIGPQSRSQLSSAATGSTSTLGPTNSRAASAWLWCTATTQRW